METEQTPDMIISDDICVAAISNYNYYSFKLASCMI